MFRLVFLVCALTSVLCQDACITNITTCAGNVFKAKMDTMKAAMDTVKAKAETCFKENGCAVPTPPTSNFTKNDTCMKEAAGLVETCVSSKTGTTFKFPEMKDDAEHNGFLMDIEHIEQMVNKSCDGNKTSAKSVMDCFKKIKPTGPTVKEYPPNNPLCEVLDGCAKNQSTVCQSEYKNVTAALCSCARNATINASFHTCMNPQNQKQKRGADHQSFQRGGDTGRDKKNSRQEKGSAMHKPMGPEVFCICEEPTTRNP